MKIVSVLWITNIYVIELTCGLYWENIGRVLFLASPLTCKKKKNSTNIFQYGPNKLVQ